MTTISIPVSIIFSFAVASNGPNWRLWHPVLFWKISAYRHQPVAVDLFPSWGLKGGCKRAFRFYFPHTSFWHFRSSSSKFYITIFIHLTGQFNVLNVHSWNTETTRNCQSGLYSYFCMWRNSSPFLFFMFFLAYLFVTSLSPVLNAWRNTHWTRTEKKRNLIFMHTVTINNSLLVFTWNLNKPNLVVCVLINSERNYS